MNSTNPKPSKSGAKIGTATVVGAIFGFIVGTSAGFDPAVTLAMAISLGAGLALIVYATKH